MVIIIVENKWFDLIFVNLYVLIEKKTQEEKDKFYDNIESILEVISNSTIQIILSDMNTKIGKGHTFKPTIVSHSLHEITNDIVCD